jgi:hypothetical protein
VVPRVGEFVKFDNKEQGDYFAWRVTQVTYRESGKIEVWTELLNDVDNRGYSFEAEQEFDEYLKSYIAEGWRCYHGIKPNTRYKAGAHSRRAVPNKGMERTRKRRRSS